MSIAVRFILPRPHDDPRRFEAGGANEFDVEYGWPITVPREGDRVDADGSDDAFPEGVYTVASVTWEIGLRGPRRATLTLC